MDRLQKMYVCKITEAREQSAIKVQETTRKKTNEEHKASRKERKKKKRRREAHAKHTKPPLHSYFHKLEDKRCQSGSNKGRQTRRGLCKGYFYGTIRRRTRKKKEGRMKKIKAVARSKRRKRKKGECVR
ncbi:hypothetical protein K457DRAFT_1429738 [Linnemannia elongata AG-77]|uniref:Uncharacterized protein n=1 Tax=Linnemannia elongata AG-77 TaxID=1314771 RepID=A0A197KCV9_9FUNG|nr:hypothetical protein K457DRAFT_1429738 [Linnemannia elongata AG-77]